MSERKVSPYLDWAVGELLTEFRNVGMGSQINAELQGALQAKLTGNLVDSIDRHERAATKLANRLLWLNIILGFFTILGTVLAVFTFLPGREG
jgi:Mg2+ and Co2+ transporter CorA